MENEDRVFDGQKLRSLRHASDHSIRDVADAVGVSRNQVMFWERGRGLPTVNRLPKIARVFGCLIDDLFSNPE